MQSLAVALSVVFLFYSIFDFDLIIGFYVMASFVVANFFARISFIAPAGIGVREGVWIAILVNFLSMSTAGLISILSRIFLIIVDILFYIFVLAVKRYKELRRLSAE